MTKLTCDIMSLSVETKESLHAKYNPDGSPLRIYQLRLLEILKYFDSVCKANNIKYWLSGGTCLGAVRHDGFIPWDDDIDVAMFRDDFEKLVSVFKETDDFALQTYMNDPHYICTYAKVRDKHSWIFESVHTSKYKYTGAFVDVFIIEKGLPSIGKMTSHLTRFLDRIDQKDPSNVFFDTTFQICKPFFLAIIKLLQQMTRNVKRSEYMIGYGSPFWYQKYYINDIINIKYKYFEGTLFPVPADCDHYLSSIYGDYNSLPDLSKVKGEMHVKDLKYL